MDLQGLRNLVQSFAEKALSFETKVRTSLGTNKTDSTGQQILQKKEPSPEALSNPLKSKTTESAHLSKKIETLCKEIVYSPKEIKKAFIENIFGQTLEYKLKNHFPGLSKEDQQTILVLERGVVAETRQIRNAIPDSEYMDADLKERAVLLGSLRNKLQANPEQIIKELQEGRNDPLYLKMGPLKFLGVLARIDENIAEMNANPDPSKHFAGDKLNSVQRVALFGYTTGDYRTINPALREAKGREIKDPALATYVQHNKDALAALPNIKVTPDLELKRAIFNVPSQDWANSSFQTGKIFHDDAFASATNRFEQGGQINLTFIPAKGTTEIAHAKVVGPPYSFYSGKEAEVLFEPGTQFRVGEVKRSPSGVITSVELHCLE